MSEHRLERNVGFQVGPKFSTIKGQVMFTFGIDPNNVIGPRPALTSDYEKYPGEWEAYKANHVSAGDDDLEVVGEQNENQPSGRVEFAARRKPGRPKKE